MRWPGLVLCARLVECSDEGNRNCLVCEAVGTIDGRERQEGPYLVPDLVSHQRSWRGPDFNFTGQVLVLNL